MNEATERIWASNYNEVRNKLQITTVWNDNDPIQWQLEKPKSSSNCLFVFARSRAFCNAFLFVEASNFNDAENFPLVLFLLFFFFAVDFVLTCTHADIEITNDEQKGKE